MSKVDNRKIVNDFPMPILVERNVAKSIKKREWLSLYMCDCGNYFICRNYHADSGKTKSCGCLHRKINSIVHTKDGRSVYNKRLYKIWNCIKTRTRSCYKGRHLYYDKGVIVCEEWQVYDNFLNWALANGYSDGLCIDRISSNGIYSPQNCRWVTKKENLQNRTNCYTNQDVLWIRNLIKNGYTDLCIAKMFATEKRSVYNIRTGKTFTNVIDTPTKITYQILL